MRPDRPLTSTICNTSKQVFILILMMIFIIPGRSAFDHLENPITIRSKSMTPGCHQGEITLSRNLRPLIPRNNFRRCRAETILRFWRGMSQEKMMWGMVQEEFWISRTAEAGTTNLLRVATTTRQRNLPLIGLSIKIGVGGTMEWVSILRVNLERPAKIVGTVRWRVLLIGIRCRVRVWGRGERPSRWRG